LLKAIISKFSQVRPTSREKMPSFSPPTDPHAENYNKKQQ